MLPTWFAVVGTVVGALGSVSYLVSTLLGKVKPNRVSFLMWSIAPIIAFFAEIGQGVGLLSIQTLALASCRFSFS